MNSISEKLVLNADTLASKILKGAVALFPTDTLVAIGACPDHAYKVWRLKNRPKQKPLILMGSSKEQLLDFVAPFALKDAGLMAEKYWPGPLTLVLPFYGKYLDALNPEKKTIGMRVPDCDLAKTLLEITGPLATTSANLSGESPTLTAYSASLCFPDLPLLGPTPWEKCSGLASTLISWERSGCWQIIRKGAVIPEETDY